MPSTQGKALRFCGVWGGIGFQTGGGVTGGGGGGGAEPGLKAIVAWGLVSRGCGNWTVAPGSEIGGLSNGDPSSRQKLKASSV